MAFMLCAAVSASALTYKVGANGGTHADIQAAINDCPATGCEIQLLDAKFDLPNSLLIREKSNIVIRGANPSIRPVITFQDAGLLAGPDPNPDSLRFKKAGWKKWPTTCGTAEGGSKDVANNPFSTSGYQHNGIILIQSSRNITIENIVLDGKKPVQYGSNGIWDCKYPTWFGNIGINLFLSGGVSVRNTEIRNNFASFYIYGRNKGGVMARNNQSDLDADKLVPNSSFGAVGGHLIERSQLHDNVWGVYVESDWDLGTTFRHNLVYNNHADPTEFAKIIGAGAATANSEAKNHVGGFLFAKDFVVVPYKIHNNTFWQNSLVFGDGGWRAGVQHYFYNNIVAEPFFDYNLDTSSFRSGNFTTPFRNQQHTLKLYGEFVHSNTFALFPRNIHAGVAPSVTTVKATLTRGDSVMPKPRLQLQTQTRNVNFTSASYKGAWVTFVKPVSVSYTFIDNVQYQQNEQHFPFDDWTLEAPARSFTKKPYSLSGKVFGIADKDYPPNVKAGDSIPITDTQLEWSSMDSAQVRAWTDTLGRILKVGHLADGGVRNNHYIKSIPFKSTRPGTAGFLEPLWGDKGVDSVVLDKGWGLGGTYALRDPDGSIIERGAISKSGTSAVSPQLVIKDDQPVFYDGSTATFSFGLEGLNGTFTDLKYALVRYVASVPDADAPSSNQYKGAGAQPVALAIGSVPRIGSNTITATLPAPPDSMSRIEMVVTGRTSTGQQIMSTVGIWLNRKTDYSFDVVFLDPATRLPIQETRVGRPVIMRITPKQRSAVFTQPVNDLTITANRIFDATTGRQILVSPPFKPSIQGSQDYSVFFTERGLQTVRATGVAGSSASPAAFLGAGIINVRPGSPYRAEFEDPASRRHFSDSTEIPRGSRYPMRLVVLDSLDNVVDTGSTVTVLSRDPSMGVVGLSGDPSQGSVVVQVDSTGRFEVLTKPVGPAPFGRYWVVSQLVAADSARIAIGMPKEQFAWVYRPAKDSIWRYVKDTAHVRLQLVDGAGLPVAATNPMLPVTAYLSTAKGTSFYLPGDLLTPLDSVTMTGSSIELVVTAAQPIDGDTLRASNPQVFFGQNAVFAPVTFFQPPIPPFPVAASASFTDGDCDGHADRLTVAMSGGPRDGRLDPAAHRVDSVVVSYLGQTHTLRAGWTFPAGDSSKFVLPLPQDPGFNTALQGKTRVFLTLRRTAGPDSAVPAGREIDVRDAIGPRLVDTVRIYRNWLPATTPDTLFVAFSEPVRYVGQAWPFVVVSPAGDDRPLPPLSVLSAAPVDPAEPTRWMLVVQGNGDQPGSFRAPDGFRIHAASGLTDLSDNPGAECPSAVVPSRMVPRPGPFQFEPVIWPKPILDRNVPTLEKGGKGLSLWTRRDETAAWKRIDEPGVVDNAGAIDLGSSGMVGVRIIISRNFLADVHVFDNLGVHVVSKQVAIAQRLLDQGEVEKDEDDSYEILIGWDGTDASGGKVAGGPYVLRVVGYYDLPKAGSSEPQRVFISNDIYKVGIQ